MLIFSGGQTRKDVGPTSEAVYKIQYVLYNHTCSIIDKVDYPNIFYAHGYRPRITISQKAKIGSPLLKKGELWN